MNETLQPYYYLDNFRFLIEWVKERYSDLLSSDEHAFIQRFSQLDRHSQCLLVRMIGRKGPWYRATKLSYVEIANHNDCADRLIETQLVDVDKPMDVTELASVLTKPELLLIFDKDLRAYKAERKEKLVQLLCSTVLTSQTWEQWTNNQFGRLYRLDIQPIIDTLLLLFFGNPYQDLTEFVLQDLGLYRYECYTIDRHHRIFKSRDEITYYQKILLLREHLANAENRESLLELVTQLPAAFHNSAMERRRARLVNHLAYELERYGEIETAMRLYQQTDAPPSRERQIRLLEKAGHHEQAWQLLNALMNNPVNEHELQIAERIAPRLAKKCGASCKKRPTSNTVIQKMVLPQLAGDNGNFLRVEEIVRRHLDLDAPCLYAENELFNSLFGLWLWPELFRSVDGAFANPFQSGPLDLYQDNFQSNRPEIQKLWQFFDGDTYKTHIHAVWAQKQGITNPFVNWYFLDEDTLLLALRCIPAAHLKAIFQRLLFDLKNNRSGLPDLIQFFPASNCYRLIEVKGPGDRIQDNQQRWLNFFNAHNIPAEVCYVSWQ